MFVIYFKKVKQQKVNRAPVCAIFKQTKTRQLVLRSNKTILKNVLKSLYNTRELNRHLDSP